MRDSAIFYRSFYEAIKEIPDVNQLEVYNAVFEYMFNFNEVELKGLSKTIFTLIKPQLQANYKRYQNGKNGGRPSGDNQNETDTEPDNNQNETGEQPNKNKNENSNENSNENNTPKPPKGDSIDFNNLLKVINAKTGREFKVISDPVKKKYLARLKEGYTKDDIAAAITNAVKDQFHAENGFKFLTPEFFSRAATIDKHSNTKINGQGLETGPRRKKL